MEDPDKADSSVLIAEDDDLVLEILTRICKEFFGEVVVRNNGADALKVVGTRPFDLVVSDLRMPGATGLALLAEARRVSASVPLLLISGYADDEATSQARSLGAHVLHKPFGARGLRQAIRALCPTLSG